MNYRAWSTGLFLAASIAAAEAGTAYDFDGDGKADPSVYVRESGMWHWLASAAGSIQNQALGWAETRPVPADYDGDGKTDFAVYHRQTGTWYILCSSIQAMRIVPFGWDAAHPVAADYDGDGKADMAVYYRDAGLWHILQSSTFTLRTVQFGFRDGRPIPADFDGDGKADFAVFYRNTADWYVWSSAQNQMLTGRFGSRTSRPVPADYDGDAKADPAVYEAASGTWSIRSSRTGAINSVVFGSAQGRPVPADYDGDGKVDPAVYNRMTGYWSILQSSNNTVRSLWFGSQNTLPIPACADGGREGLVCMAFGDSITYGGGSSSDGPATGYPILLERILEAEFGGHFITANEGIPGEDSGEGASRFSAMLAADNPDVVLLMEGTNDNLYDDAAGWLEPNLRYMVGLALSRGIQVVIGTIPPVISNEYRDRSAQMANIMAFNPRIYSIAADYGIPLAPVFESITSVPGWDRALMDQPSANHPNDAGYRVVRDAFFHAVASGIESGLFY